MRYVIILLLVLVAGWSVVAVLRSPKMSASRNNINPSEAISSVPKFPLAVEYMRRRQYPGSEITIEQKLGNGSNYSQYVVSYKSDELKIYALMTVPLSEKPPGGFPVIVFNHGYIQPQKYKTTERYVAYVDAFARNGYIVFKPDYRGNGSSEGKPEGAYYSPAYAIDDLNAIASVKKYKDANPDRIGVWGHSMGGNITLRDIVTNQGDVKAAVIWGGVVATYDDIMNHWRRARPFQPSERERLVRNNQRQRMITQYGTPASNPTFWNSIDPNAFISDITTPVQIHHGGADGEVPVEFSKSLYDRLKQAGKTAELYTYPGADHNISSPAFETAMDRTLAFFNKYLK